MPMATKTRTTTVMISKHIARYQAMLLNERTVKSAFMHHAPNLEMMNSQNWNQTMDLGIEQTAKLTVVYAVVLY